MSPLRPRWGKDIRFGGFLDFGYGLDLGNADKIWGKKKELL